MIAQLADEDVLKLTAQKLDGAGQKVMGERAGSGHSLHAPIDAGGLVDADDDRKRTFAIDLFEIDDLLLRSLADDDPRKFHLDGHGGRSPLASRHRLTAATETRGNSP